MCIHAMSIPTSTDAQTGEFVLTCWTIGEAAAGKAIFYLTLTTTLPFARPLST